MPGQHFRVVRRFLLRKRCRRHPQPKGYACFVVGSEPAWAVGDSSSNYPAWFMAFRRTRRLSAVSSC